MDKVRIVVRRDEGGGFYVYSPDLKGCVSQGDSQVEAIRNFAEAMEAWLAVQAQKRRRARVVA